MSRNLNPLERLSRLFADPKSRSPSVQKAQNPWIVLAIGNPGDEYARSRHNVGWWAADILRRASNARLQDEGPSRVARVTIHRQSVVIAYPKTFVNRSGAAARALLGNHETETSRLIVITDDINLPPGRIRVRRGGGAGGHNGLKSIIDTLSDDEFPRVRIGVGKPSAGDSQIDHVLGEPSDDDRAAIDAATKHAAQAVESIITRGVEATMNEFNSVRA